MEENKWETTAERFVLFFDILGFKDMVQRNDHDFVLGKLNLLKNTIHDLDGLHTLEESKRLKISEKQSQSVTFSDSIIIFSKSNTVEDAYKIFSDAYIILLYALENDIPIKGALSYGKITVNFEKSLFFGQPIIDAYLLHENFQMLTVVLDHNFEKQYSLVKKDNIPTHFLVDYKVNLKTAKVTHKVFRPVAPRLAKAIESLKNHYLSVSGYPRIYIDNTMDFYLAMVEIDKTNKK